MRDASHTAHCGAVEQVANHHFVTGVLPQLLGRSSGSSSSTYLQLCSVISSIAPADALLTTGMSGAQFLEQASTPETPKQYADRSMAPKFCCSTTITTRQYNIILQRARREATS
jgi:hypothetical protein